MPNIYGKMTAREVDFNAKPESITGDVGKISSSSSTSWSTRLKDPRIVRVSRAFGGKDRHSKVCTVRGLRDRRVRLSVPTAIQLYDLQDRLGLNQPSKVVDWLLNAAKHEIDELPPLQIPPGSNFSHPVLNSHEFIRPPQSDKEFLKISHGIDWKEPLKRSQTDLWGDKSKDVSGGTTMERSEDEKLCNLEGQEAYVSSNNLFQRPNQSSVPGLLNNAMQYNSNFLRWDPSNLSLSHSRSAGLPAQPEDFHNFNLEPLPSSAVSVPSGSHQVLVYQPRMTQSYFPSPEEFDPKQVNFQMMNPSSQLSNSSPVHSTAEPVRHFNFSMTASLLPSQNSKGGKEPNKHEEFNNSV